MTAAETPGPILVVEDDADLQSILVYNLRKAGFDVVALSDGLAAWRWLEANRPALVILDILLPGLDGIELFGRVQRDARLAKTPVIITTALQEESTKRESYRIGATMVFRKPLSPTRLAKHAVAALSGPRRPADLAA